MNSVKLILQSISSFFSKKIRGDVKIICLGLDNAGKSSILRNISHRDIIHTAPTKGFSLETVQVNNLKLHVWDLGGQRQLRQFWGNYFKGSVGLIWVIDSSDRIRLEETGIYLNRVLTEKEMKKIPLLILANKQDLVTAMTAEKVAKTLNLHLIRDRNWLIKGCSAKLKGDKRIEEGFEWLSKKILGS